MTIPLRTPIGKVLSTVIGPDFAVPDSARADKFVAIVGTLTVRYQGSWSASPPRATCAPSGAPQHQLPLAKDSRISTRAHGLLLLP